MAIVKISIEVSADADAYDLARRAEEWLSQIVDVVRIEIDRSKPSDEGVDAAHVLAVGVPDKPLLTGADLVAAVRTQLDQLKARKIAGFEDKEAQRIWVTQMAAQRGWQIKQPFETLDDLEDSKLEILHRLLVLELAKIEAESN